MPYLLRNRLPAASSPPHGPTRLHVAHSLQEASQAQVRQLEAQVQELQAQLEQAAVRERAAAPQQAALVRPLASL